MAQGRVTQGTNGLSGVTISAGGKSAVTDSAGDYSLVGLCPGAYSLSASRAGYKLAPASFVLSLASNTNGLNFIATPALTLNPATNGSVQVAFPAFISSRVEASTNLRDWTTIFTTGNSSADTPVFQFNDPTATNLGARYYRVAQTLSGLPQIVRLPYSNHSLPLNFIPAPITNCQLVASTNLKDWVVIFSTNQAFSNAPFQFTDPEATNLPLRFYRMSQSPGF